MHQQTEVILQALGVRAMKIVDQTVCFITNLSRRRDLAQTVWRVEHWHGGGEGGAVGRLHPLGVDRTARNLPCAERGFSELVRKHPLGLFFLWRIGMRKARQGVRDDITNVFRVRRNVKDHVVDVEIMLDD